MAAASPNTVDFVASEHSKNSANSDYLLSNNKVFCYSDVIEGTDPDSFLYISGLYAMDKHYLFYYMDIKIPQESIPIKISNADEKYIRLEGKVLYSEKLLGDQADNFTVI